MLHRGARKLIDACPVLYGRFHQAHHGALRKERPKSASGGEAAVERLHWVAGPDVGLGVGIKCTEDGRAADSFLGPGRRYRVGGEGLVLIGTETFAGDGQGAEIAVTSV